MGIINNNTSISGSGGARGPRGVKGRGIETITTQDNNDGSINLTIIYDDGSSPQTFTNTLVSDTLIQLEKLTLEGTNNSTKFSINQQDDTVIYKCDTTSGINIMKNLLVGGDGVKKINLRNDEIAFIDSTGEHFKLSGSDNSGQLTCKSLVGNQSRIVLKNLNDEEILNISDINGVNYYPSQVNYGKASDIGGIKLSVKNNGITAQRDMSILSKNLLVNNGIDIFKVRNDNSRTEIYKLFTRDIISDTEINFLDGNELLVMKLDTDNRNLQLADTQFTMTSGENITLKNEPLTGITSILKTKTDKIIIPDTYLDIVDTNETIIMKVKTDNTVDVYNQINIKGSSGGGGNYTDFAFTTLGNIENTYFAFQCATNFMIQQTPLTCSGVLDFISQYSALVNTTCIQTGDMTSFSLTINQVGQFQFQFTAGMGGPYAFAFAPELAVQIGMSSNPPDNSKIINGGTGVGLVYFLFQTSATAGATYTFTSDGLFGNTINNDSLAITPTSISSAGDITVDSNNLNINSTTLTMENDTLNINTPDINIISSDMNINSAILDITSSTSVSISSGSLTLTGPSLLLDIPTTIAKGNVFLEKQLSVGTQPNPSFGGQMLTVYNPITTEEIFYVNPIFTYIKTLNDITFEPNKGCFYYANENTGALNFFPRPDYDCSFLVWKTNKPEWRIPYMCQLINNPYINSPTGQGTNPATTISGFTELKISDTNIQFNSEPNPSHFTRQANGNTTITYVGQPFTANDYKMRITYTVSLSGFNNQTIAIGLFINGNLYAPSINKMVFSSNSEYEILCRTVVLPLLKNDILSVRVNSDQTTITVSNYNMLIEVAC